MAGEETAQIESLETDIEEPLLDEAGGDTDIPEEQAAAEPQGWDALSPKEAAERAYALGIREAEAAYAQRFAQMQQSQQRQQAPPVPQDEDYSQAAKAIAERMSMEIVKNPQGDGGQNMIAGLLKGLTEIIENKVVPEAIGRSQATVRAHQDKERFFQERQHLTHFRPILEHLATSQEHAEALDRELITPLLALAAEKNNQVKQLARSRRQQGYAENAWGRQPLDAASIKDTDIKALAKKIFG